MKTKFFSLLFLFISFLSISIEDDDVLVHPSLRYSIQQSEIKKVEEILINKFLSKDSFDIPALTYSEHLSFIGTVELYISNIVFKFLNPSPESLGISFEEPDKVKGKLDSIKGSLSFYYVFSSNFYSNEGKGEINLDNIKINATSRLLQVDNLKQADKKCLSVEVEDFNIESADFYFNFENEGDLEKIIIYFVNNLRKAIINNINQEFNNNQIEKFNNEINNFFANQELSFQLNNDSLYLDYSMNQKPIITNNSLEMAFEASFREGEEIIYTGPTYDIPKPFRTNSTVDVIISQYIFENYFYILYMKNELNSYMKNDDLPLSLLIVSTFNKIFPQLSPTYKNDQEVELNLTAIKEPKFTLNEKESYIIFYYNSVIKILSEDKKTKADVISGDAEVLVNMTFTPQKGKISLDVNSISLKSFTNVDSKVGTIDEQDTIKNFSKLLDTILPFVKSIIKSKIESITFPSINGIVLEVSYMESHKQSLSLGVSPVIKEKKLLL